MFIDVVNKFHYEERFYQTCDISRMDKAICHYELLHHTVEIPGDIVEVGVFHGTSFIRFAMLRNLLGLENKKALIGFDTFDVFPSITDEIDEAVGEFVEKTGGKSLSMKELQEILSNKNCDNVQLIPGDVCETLPQYVNSSSRFSLINLDVDLYKPSRAALEWLWPWLSIGGVLILDNYGVFPGETKAVQEFFRGQDVIIQQFPFNSSPCFIVKR